jgi:hypothetical protein
MVWIGKYLDKEAGQVAPRDLYLNINTTPII